MNEYEIRILTDALRSSFIIEAYYPDDIEAIRTARKLADNRSVEVWRGLDCIHRANQTTAPSTHAA